MATTTSPLWAPRLPLPPLDIVCGRGAWLHGRDGRRYFDGSSGSVCVNVGHAQPRVVAAIARQAAEVAFAHPGAREPRELRALAEHLAASLAVPQHRIVFSSTGTAAIELAISLARQHQRLAGHPERVDVLTADISYHGCSALTLGLSGHRRRRPRPEEAFGLAPAFHSPYGLAADRGHRCTVLCADEVGELVDRSGRVAAVLIEPVNGTTGGGFVAPDGYLTRLARICHDRGVLVIHDEVLSGLGRCGLPLASAAEPGAAADLVVLSKGLGAGYATISAVVAAPAIAEAIEAAGEPLPLGGTMAGAPLAAATALAVQEVLDESGALHQPERGADFGARLRRALGGFEVVRHVRGMGFFHGVELAPGSLSDVVRLTRDCEVVLYPFNGFRAGGGGEGVLVAPPLTCADHELAWLVERLVDACARADDEIAVASP